MPTQLVQQEEQLLEAVKAGREDKVRALLSSGCRLEAVDADGRTALHWACHYGHLAILCLLLSHTPAAFTPPPDSQPCPSCALSLRLNNDAKEKQSVRNLKGEFKTPEHGGGSLNSEGDAETLDNDDGLGGSGEKSLVHKNHHVQARKGPCTCVSRLTAHEVNRRDTKGHTPLHVACNYRRDDVAAFLVTLPSCDINAADKAGNTPLHRAIHADLHTLACLLCDAGADVTATNSQLRTPLHEAIRSGNHDVIRTLIARGCDVNAVTSSMAATTPFLTAIFYHRISSRSLQCGQALDTTLRLLIEAGCRLSEGDYQWTPLSATIDIDRSFIASLLLFNGCRVQRAYSDERKHSHNLNQLLPSSYSRSLLVEAFSRCESHVVKLLVLCGYQPTPEEVEQCSRRIPSFSPLFYRISTSERAATRAKTQLLHWLGQRASSTCTLMELSRTAVRTALNHAAGDTSILKRVPHLPLPSAMRHYVGLSDFTEILML
ncbi:hypothetical protein V1264_000331 [Littorina saxatilis]|uniref:SOCS box domain-containing protein n=1 Tax=Littorina saxatilis TaxID=31220 RepID=A0AAN9GMM3_9CAEN